MHVGGKKYSTSQIEYLAIAPRTILYYSILAYTCWWAIYSPTDCIDFSVLRAWHFQAGFASIGQRRLDDITWIVFRAASGGALSIERRGLAVTNSLNGSGRPLDRPREIDDILMHPGSEVVSL